MIDYSKVQFMSGTTMDRIVVVASKNASGAPLSVAIPAGSTTSGNFYTTSYANTSGLEGIATVSFSIDNSNFYPSTTTLQYYNSTNLGYYTDMSVYGVATASRIIFYFYTENPAAKTVYFNLALGVF